MATGGPLPYLSWCGVEVGNAARTVEYLRLGLGATLQGHWELGPGQICPVLYKQNGIAAVYQSPALDPAPWYDASEPGAASFLGFVLLDLAGYDSTLTRLVTPRNNSFGGGTFGGQHRNPRTWKFRGALISADDAGAEFGLRWLSSLLQANPCDTCDTCSLDIRLVCPPANGSNDDLGHWFSYDVALIDGPHEVEQFGPAKLRPDPDTLAGCRDWVTVEFTIAAGNPYLYKPPVLCLPPTIVGQQALCTGTYWSDATSEPSLDLYWRMDETAGVAALDSFDSHPGVYANATLNQPPLVAADPGGSVRFNGTTTRITSAYAAFPQNARRTWRGWAIRDNNAGNDCIMGSDGGANQVILSAIAGGNDVSFWVNAAGAQVTWAGALPAPGGVFGPPPRRTGRGFIQRSSGRMRGSQLMTPLAGQVRAIQAIENIRARQVPHSRLNPPVKTEVPFQWALTWNAATKVAELFINGISKGTRVAPADFVVAPGNFEVGSWGGGNDFWVGRQSQVQAFTNILSAADILYDYQLGSGQIPILTICDYLFGDAGDPVCCSVTPPQKGSVGAIYTFQSVTGMGSILMESYAGDCGHVGGIPVQQLELSGVPAGSTVVVDCAKRTVTVTDASGNVSDGKSLLVLPTGRGLEWIEAADCNQVYCFCARTAHPCSQGYDTTVMIQTQAREG